MKKLIVYSFLLISCILPNLSFATNGDWIEKRKVITKNYDVNAGTKLNITNTFGDVNVKNWDDNSIKVVITVFASSKDEAVAQTILDQIWIDEKTDPIHLETRIGGNDTKRLPKLKMHIDSKMEITYEVFLPQAVSLSVKNSFGDTFIPDRNGLTNLSQSFGSLNVGKLSNIQGLLVEFGKLNASEIDAKKITSSYSDINIKSLEGSLNSKFDFCNKMQIGLGQNLDTLAINTSYSDLKINLSQLSDATLLIKTSFGDVINKSRIKLDGNKGSDTGKNYSGKSGNGKTYIKIDSSFGFINLN